MSDAMNPEQFRSLMQWRDWDGLKAALSELQNQDIAMHCTHLDAEDWVLLIKLLPQERASDVFSYLDFLQQYRILQDLTDTEKTTLLQGVSYDDIVAVLERLAEADQKTLTDLLPMQQRLHVQRLLTYPKDSVGRHMTPGFLSIRPQWTLQQALDYLRTHFAEGETINLILVTDIQGRLKGVLELKQLLFGIPSKQVATLLENDVISIHPEQDQEEAARLIRHYDLEVLPVVDNDNILLGIMTVDDVMDVVTEETTEDFLRMGSIEPISFGLKDAALSLLYRKRVGWLVILIFVNLFSGAAIAVFETAIEAVVALVFFLPLVIASGGNAGSQASTLMVRALATGDVKLRDWLSLWGKELVVSIALGVTLGLAVWGAANWLGGPDVGLAVAMAMVLVVIVGSMIGMLLPLLLTRVKLDPATASAPLVTSIADVGGILVYFSVATVVLQL